MKLEDILAPYDALIVDLWGVVHDGSSLYPGVAETLALLHQMHKPVLFLSNAPRVAAKARIGLSHLNIPRSHYVDVITSGQVAHDMLAAAPGKRRYYYLGPGKDEDILADLPAYERADEAHADFILCTGYEEDGQPHEAILPLLAQLMHLPMLCVNPDMEVVKQDGTQWLCAGMVAAEFSRMGGRVSYVGKPFKDVYDACRRVLGSARTLCIGDNPATDIKGANDAGLDALLITGGILKARHGETNPIETAQEICRIAGVTPNYILPGFSLV